MDEVTCRVASLALAGWNSPLMCEGGLDARLNTKRDRLSQFLDERHARRQDPCWAVRVPGTWHAALGIRRAQPAVMTIDRGRENGIWEGWPVKQASGAVSSISAISLRRDGTLPRVLRLA